MLNGSTIRSSTLQLHTANARRHAERTPAQIATAKRALQYVTIDTQQEALRLRVDNPHATLSTLGALCNPPVSKDAYWSRLRLGMRHAR